MTSQASPATVRFPTIQKLANRLSAAPRRELGWNSAKYDQTTSRFLKLYLFLFLFIFLSYWYASSNTNSTDEPEQKEKVELLAERREEPSDGIHQHCVNENLPPAKCVPQAAPNIASDGDEYFF